jgi:Predicted integral membrane protein (DUF2269)
VAALLAVNAQVPGELSFYTFVVFLHIAAAVVGFGAIFVYPVFLRIGLASEPRGMPLLHRAQSFIGARVITGALVVMLLAGLYMAAQGPYDFGEPFVGEGIIAILILGAIAGAYLSPRERRLLELSQRDLAAAGPEPVRFSRDYVDLARRVELAAYLMGGVVLVTILFMVFKPGT